MIAGLNGFPVQQTVVMCPPDLKVPERSSSMRYWVISRGRMVLKVPDAAGGREVRSSRPSMNSARPDISTRRRLVKGVIKEEHYLFLGLSARALDKDFES